MAHTLVIGNRNYSSWSMRAGLLLDHPWVVEWFTLGAAEAGTIPMFELPPRL